MNKRSKYSFDDVKIGDTIVTTANETGVVVAIKSYAYLNDKLQRKADGNKMIIDLLPFANDDAKHKDVWYSTLTIAVKDKQVKEKDMYYLEGIDFIEIKEIVRDMSNVKVTLLDKIKKVLNIWHN